MENSMKGLQSSERYGPIIPLLGKYPKELKSVCSPMFVAALVTIATLQKEAKYPSSDGW
jgi:hypothetical protein